MNITAQVHLGPNDHIECVEVPAALGGEPFTVLRMGCLTIIPLFNGPERIRRVRDCIDAYLLRLRDIPAPAKPSEVVNGLWMQATGCATPEEAAARIAKLQAALLI